MKRLLFERWNWEFDFGIRQVKSVDDLPPRYCEVFVDGTGRLCRVILHEGSGPSVVAIYDYFCDGKGAVIQKRSYSDDGTPDLVIDYGYDVDGDWVTETARSRADETPRSIRRRIQVHPNYGASNDMVSD
jgi:hypothetical protein